MSIRPLAILALAAFAVAQTPERTPQPTRWIVCFRSRSFDLDALRDDCRRGAPAERIAQRCDELARTAAADQREFAAAVAERGGGVLHSFWLVNACLVQCPADVAAAFAARPDVARVWPDEAALPQFILRSTNANNHRAVVAHQQGVLGAGATVAIVDSGLDLQMGTSGRPHRAWFVDGNPQNPTGGGIGGSRVLANLQVGTQSAESIDDHGNGVAAVAAGEVWSSSPLAARGHAPRANLVGYGIANDAFGNSSLATIAMAFEQMVRDRQQYGIVCANNSYSGSNDPTHPSQQAMDAAASVGDILVAVAAGNQGSNQNAGPSCANGLAVAAVAADSKVLAPFSSWGPLQNDPRRDWPDLCACGVDIVMPARDTEAATQSYVASGTSFAAPQVCGAAALYRSVRPAASALETKAAILCTTEDVAPQNRWSVPATPRTLGTGFLRDDRLVALAQGQGLVQSAALTAAQPVLQTSLPVLAGRTYAAVVAWHRHVLGDIDWSDLSLVVRDAQGRQLAVSDSPRNLAEKCVFTAAVDGAVTLVVAARHLEIASLPIALVACETGPQTVPGGALAFGAGCPGSGLPDGVDAVAPPALAQHFGDLVNNLLVDTDRRNQLVVRGDLVPAGRITGLRFRFNDVAGQTPLPFWSEIQMAMAVSPNRPATLSPTFAQNAPNARVVFARRRVDWPLLLDANHDPAAFAIELPLDQPFDWTAPAGGHLLVELRVFAGNATPFTDRYWVDGMWDQNDPDPAMTQLLGVGANSTIGGALPGRAAVIGLVMAPPSGRTPDLRAASLPVLGRPYWLDVARVPANATGFLVVGFDDRRWGGGPLPFDLAAIGAPGCRLLTSSDGADLLLADAAGRARATRLVPLAAGLLGARVFHQLAVLDPVANAAGLTTSNAVLGVVGDRW